MGPGIVFIHPGSSPYNGVLLCQFMYAEILIKHKSSFEVDATLEFEGKFIMLGQQEFHTDLV